MQQHKPVNVSNPIADLANSAVSHARAGQWERAAKANRELIGLAPNDVEAHNRLGKALSELGKLREATAAFQRAADLQPGNAIARRNLDRLKQLAGSAVSVARGSAAAHANSAAFLATGGTAIVAELVKPGVPKALASAASGNRLTIEASGEEVRLANTQGSYVGSLEPRLARRLARLTQGGNRYEATVVGFAGRTLSVLLRETYRSPKQATVTSFPMFLQKQVEGDDRPAAEEMRPDQFMERRMMRLGMAEGFDDDENPRAQPELDGRALIGLGSELEEVSSLTYGDR